MKVPENEDRSPIVDPSRRDTKTNIMMTLGVVVFLVITGVFAIIYFANQDDLGDEVHEEYADPAIRN